MVVNRLAFPESRFVCDPLTALRPATKFKRYRWPGILLPSKPAKGNERAKVLALQPGLCCFFQNPKVHAKSSGIVIMPIYSRWLCVSKRFNWSCDCVRASSVIYCRLILPELEIWLVQATHGLLPSHRAGPCQGLGARHWPAVAVHLAQFSQGQACGRCVQASLV